MKSLFISCLFILPLILNAQESKKAQKSTHNEVNQLMDNLQLEMTAMTSEEEYNYMTKGYAIKLSSGLDMKKGYSISKLQKIEKGSYSFDFKKLIREKDKSLAGIIVVGHSNVSNRDYYLGIPIANEELKKRFEKQLTNWDGSMTDAYAKAASEMILLFK